MDLQNVGFGTRDDKTSSIVKKHRYSSEKLKEFKIILQSQLEVAREDYFDCKNSLTQGGENGTDDTSPTWKTLEEEAVTLSKEESGKLANHQLKKIHRLEAAIIRCENGTFGICQKTGKLIPEERLRACPLATTIIDVKPR